MFKKYFKINLHIIKFFTNPKITFYREIQNRDSTDHAGKENKTSAIHKLKSWPDKCAKQIVRIYFKTSLASIQ